MFNLSYNVPRNIYCQYHQLRNRKRKTKHYSPNACVLKAVGVCNGEKLI